MAMTPGLTEVGNTRARGRTITFHGDGTKAEGRGTEMPLAVVEKPICNLGWITETRGRPANSFTAGSELSPYPKNTGICVGPRQA